MREIATGLANDITQTAAQQTESLHTVARSVGSAADSFTQPLKKMFQPLSAFWLICTEVGQSTTFTSALMPTDLSCSWTTRAALYIEV